MAYSVKILLDSINDNGDRITTWELTYPRFIHSEFMTHRAFSRNAASSRAIPIAKMIERVKTDPAMPVYWGKNQKGMQAAEELSIPSQMVSKDIWLAARDRAVEFVEQLSELDVHKQIANRLLEPWMYITVIMTCTNIDNFFTLRCHKDAQPEFKKLADMMKEEYIKSKPRILADGDWHIPMLLPDDNEFPIDIKLHISTARCARVSYLTHDGRRDYSEDVRLHNQLLESKHMSPFEHCAQSIPDGIRSANFTGWHQYRSVIETHILVDQLAESSDSKTLK